MCCCFPQWHFQEVQKRVSTVQGRTSSAGLALLLCEHLSAWTGLYHRMVLESLLCMQMCRRTGRYLLATIQTIWTGQSMRGRWSSVYSLVLLSVIVYSQHKYTSKHMSVSPISPQCTINKFTSLLSPAQLSMVSIILLPHHLLRPRPRVTRARFRLRDWAEEA